MRVHRVYELFPRLLFEVLEFLVNLWRQFKIKLVDILQNIMSSNHFGNFDQLIIVVCPLEKRFSLENHSSEHAARAPDIKLIVVMGHSHKQLWSFEKPTRHSTVETLLRRIEVRKTPICDPHLPSFMVDQHIIWLYISMNNTSRVSEIKANQDLQDVLLNILKSKSCIQFSEICRIDILKY